MNIAIIAPEYPVYNNAGGIATFLSALAKLLANQGYRVFVFTDIHNQTIKQTGQKSITVIPLYHLLNIKFIRVFISNYPGKLIAKFSKKYFPTLTQLILLNIVTIITFMNFKKGHTVHIIHTPVLWAPAWLLSYLYPKIPLVTHAQGPDELMQKFDYITRDTILKTAIETSYMRHSDYIVACSISVRTYLINKFQSIKNKIWYIPNFIDTKDFIYKSSKIDKNTLLFFGRLEYRKGPDLVVKAFQKLIRIYPKLNLIIMGEDVGGWLVNGKLCLFSEYVKSLNILQSVHEHIKIINRIDQRAKLISFLDQHRCISVLPSRYEPFGFVFIESMMSGLITIASACGGGSEIIQNSIDGFVINPTVDNIIKCVLKIHRLDSQILTNISKMARIKVSSVYDIAQAKKSYHKLYQFIFSN